MKITIEGTEEEIRRALERIREPGGYEFTPVPAYVPLVIPSPTAVPSPTVDPDWIDSVRVYCGGYTSLRAETITPYPLDKLIATNGYVS